ncbi:M23 family metallopeptidase [Candidatus Babeliales bacterium]|nr:M23 family metallopeptidase [Candidatus Babeliales bacterium]
MFHKLKIPLLVILIGTTSFWLGNKIYLYFTHEGAPVVSLNGISQGGTCQGTVACSLSADNDYKINKILATLDGQEYSIGNTNVRSRTFELPFSLDTTKLADGKHSFEVQAQDSSYHANKATHSWEFFVDNVPLKADFLKPSYKVEQGKTLHLCIQANKLVDKATVSFLGRTYHCYPTSSTTTTYECFIAVDCEEHPVEQMLVAELEDAAQNVVKLTTKAEVAAFPFPRQKSGFSVSAKKLEHEKEISMNTKILEEAIGKWSQDSAKQKMWNGPFEMPTQIQRISTPFGEVRVTSERGRYLHKGLDLVNNPKSVVWASQSGKVIIKERYLMTGNTLVIDHGLGVTTLYAHLDEFFDVEVGDFVKKGNPIGKIGMTGYASGYHLHWELRVHNTPVDPTEWTQNIY